MRGFKALLAIFIALTLYSFLVFSLYWTIPSDPVAGILNRSSLPFLHSIPLQPLKHTPGSFWEQAQIFYEHILDGTWGVSFWTGSSVFRLILNRAPHSLWTALCSLFVTYCLGIGLAYLQLGANHRTNPLAPSGRTLERIPARKLNGAPHGLSFCRTELLWL